ncbi:RAMP superfamily CRISPR-associated protein [Pseudoalteromonas sp. OF7H-1]|uniref:RAMP superfamily CRISPR-associated protein n=1 Tax=Pseudoalteromonas sp. OF7H-1 TaxID=2917755 RepID=UPI001EF43764|nr:RAMP superfamily CRISPR-associated protein [Pseudoalteromonas sp. OF7H-1]MCG7542211.1 hypothetical protein [Pseudoalteromonas sp. OF7H-1]
MAIQLTTIKVSLTLLEDLHTGNGLGTHLIDSLQTKDANDQPVIWRQHIKGLLVAASTTINKLNNKYEECFNDLLSDSPQSNCTLVIGSFYKSKLKPNPTHILSSTAREGVTYKNNAIDMINRAPKKGSLRNQEYIKAGSEFEATWQLLCEQQFATNYIQALTVLINHLDRIGANRNRGAGRVRCDIKMDDTLLAANDVSAVNTQQSLHIIVTNLEPLRLPNTDVPGNIVPTYTYISGDRLKAALANWCLLQGKQALFEALVNEVISVSYAYPSRQGMRYIPAPLCIAAPKSHAEGTIPWWAQQTQANEFTDQFAEPSTSAPLKRLKGHFYYQPQSQTLFEQGVAVHMRNKVRTQFSMPEYKKDNGADIVNDSDLFAEEVIPEQTQFMATLSCSTNKELIAQLAHLIAQNAWPLLLGRGKAPCKLTTATEAPTPFEFNNTKPLTVVLTSPLLCYSYHTGQPYTQLEQALNQLCPELNLDKNDYTAFSEQDILTGYSFETGLPKTPTQVIAAGSCIKITNIEKAQLLAAYLKNTRAIGERQAQGLGQFLLTQQNLTATLETSFTPLSCAKEVEQQIDNIDKLIQNDTSFFNRSPSVTQWQKLKNELKRQKVNSDPKPLSNIFAELKTQQNQSKHAWLSITDFLSELEHLCSAQHEPAILACDCVLVALANHSAKQGEQA